MKKIHPALVGLLQALGVTVYCGLVSVFFWGMEKIFAEPPGVIAWILMLLLLVFSAAVTGLLVFGYPVYLTLNKKVKEALAVLGYTFLSCLVIILIIIGVVFLLK